MNRGFYRFARAVCRLILRILRRWEVIGAENMPPYGGVVVVANHTSYWDPVIVGCAFERPVYFMAKEELFRVPLLAPVIRNLGAFPVQRGSGDRRAVKMALQYLHQGQVVGIFPEGRRSHTGELLPPHLGAVMLAVRAGVPVLPVAVAGSRGLVGKVRVRVGKPVYLNEEMGKRPAREELERWGQEIMSRIATLLAG